MPFEKGNKFGCHVAWNKNKHGYFSEIALANIKCGGEKRRGESNGRWKGGKPKPINLCECGCGGVCRRRFISGHNSRTEHNTWRNRVWLHRKDAKHTEESKQLIREKRALQVFTEDTKKKWSITRTGKKHKPETIQKMKATRIQLWKDPEFAKMMFKSWHRKPNEAEKFINFQIQVTLPNEYIYSGDGKVWIEGRNPDWFNTNGKKKVIEFAGRRWHEPEYEQDRKAHYKKYGYSCLVIWSEELKDLVSLKQKLISFNTA